MSKQFDKNNTKVSAWIAFLLIIYNFCANLANDIYLPSMPELARVFKTSTNVLQLTMTAWFAGVAIPQLFFGPLTDYFGRRPILLFGGICFLIASLVCMFAPSVWILIVGRFFQGVGVCSLNVTTFSILSDLYDYKSRAKITNKISVCATLAPLIGPVIGGYILIYVGYQFNFALIFLLGLLAIIGLWWKLPESNLYLNPHALYLKNIYKNYLLLLKTQGFLKNLIPYCLLLGGLVAYLTAAPFIIINHLHYSAEHFGYTQLPIFAAFILGALLFNKTEQEENLQKLCSAGSIFVFIAGISFFAAAFLFGNNIYVIITPMVFYAFGLSLCGSALINNVMSCATFSKGSAAAFLGFGMALSCTLASACLGYIYNGSVTSIAAIILFVACTSFAVYFWKTAKQEVVVEQA